jgi:hypothetical protein
VTVRVPTTGFNSTNPKVATASCAAGQVAVGGGYEIEGGTLAEDELEDLAVSYSRPTAALDGWTVRVVEANPVTETWAVSAYVICATTVAP